MQLGFVIDQRKCIGCHACTVACKMENEVPVGSFRTWVKYTEKGTFPSVRRHFTILRCNHCDAAPCVEICPVNALHKRKDAIVDLDRDLCIGCRACMQACPYDALYLNDERGVAEKCHFCAHRTEVGLEPACVIVCPVQAIVAGDTSDPETPISKLIREQQTSRRRLEKGTKPRVWYIDALPESLVPGAAAEPSSYLWSDRAPHDQPPPVVPGYEPTPDITTVLDAPHRPEWGWHVWLYLVTKNISAGAAMVAPFLAWLGIASGFARDFIPEIVALIFLAITNVLLVHDLGRPERAWRIMFAPNTKSWLVKGAWVLTGFGLVTTAALIARWAHAPGLANALRWLNLPLALMTSGYSAFLFAQCKGRDLWLDGTLLWKLLLRAAVFGAALASLLVTSPTMAPALLAAAFLTGLMVVAGPWRLSQSTARGLEVSLGMLAVLGFYLALAPAQATEFNPGMRFPAVILATACLLAAMVVHERAFVHEGQARAIS